MSHQKKSFTSFKANESAVPDDPKDVSLAGAEAEKRESLKMVIRRVGDNCYVISGLPSAESVQENSTVLKCNETANAEYLLFRLSSITSCGDRNRRTENDDAHDAVYEPRRSSPLTDSLDGELNNFNPLATETTMENGDICWEGAKNESQVDPSADIIVTLLNLLDYCISSEVTVNDVRAKIIEEVMNLMRNKDGGTGKF
ncbi:hypothetical protein Tsp_12026 [Trichinella spiralis]|uniref:hypothetical protein n=1 Tax=Trichinella spiralis TaxID=6334 RepID=UPI0001EFD3FB|nr:hypothetical protein Tsp_12026 [Trichinella spiralis]